jgi:hypothetical protein
VPAVESVVWTWGQKSCRFVAAPWSCELGEIEYDHLSFDLETPASCSFSSLIRALTFAWHRIHELTDSVCRLSMQCVSCSAGQRGSVGHGRRAWSRPSTVAAAQQTAQGEHEARDATGIQGGEGEATQPVRASQRAVRAMPERGGSDNGDGRLTTCLLRGTPVTMRILFLTVHAAGG